jgi:dihydropteroate synthase
VKPLAIRRWKVGAREIVLDRPIVMGILNVTPEGSAVGGVFSVEAVVERAARMVDEGADILDIGGEPTRPGAAPAAADDELKRVIPSLKAVRERWPDLPLSIDTAKSGIARSAIEVGADIINDVSAMRLDPVMPIVAGSSGCGMILTHSRGGISDMSTYAHAKYTNVTNEVIAELSSQLLVADAAGVDRKSVVVDPGFGFSKKSEHSVRLLGELDRFAQLDVPIMVGVSRKRFVREAAGVSDPASDDSDGATTAVNVIALERGARIFRVHNVKMARRALDTAWAIQNAS